MRKSTPPWVCIDASFLIPLVTQPASHSPWATQWETWHNLGVQPAAPSLLYYEVANVLYRMTRHELITQAEANEALDAALGFDIALIGDHELHRRAGILAFKFAFPATYDAHYLALAQRLQAELWTGDRRLHQKASAMFPWIHLLA